MYPQASPFLVFSNSFFPSSPADKMCPHTYVGQSFLGAQTLETPALILASVLPVPSCAIFAKSLTSPSL